GAVADAARQFADTRDAPSVSTPSRLLSTNSGNRVQWWGEALGAWSDRPLAGHGAGSFPALHLQYRHNRLPVRQPHDAPLQFLASALLPAVADHKADGALRAAQPGASPATLHDAAARADLAARLDPLAVRPLFAGAAIAQRRGRELEVRRLLLDAVRREPSNA